MSGLVKGFGSGFDLIAIIGLMANFQSDSLIHTQFPTLEASACRPISPAVVFYLKPGNGESALFLASVPSLRFLVFHFRDGIPMTMRSIYVLKPRPDEGDVSFCSLPVPGSFAGGFTMPLASMLKNYFDTRYSTRGSGRDADDSKRRGLVVGCHFRIHPGETWTSTDGAGYRQLSEKT